MAECRRLNAELGLGLGAAHFEKRLWWISSFPQHLITDAVPRRYLDLYDRRALMLPPNVHPHWQTLAGYQLHEYYAMVSAVDAQVGRALAHLRARSDGRPTVVVYTSDHGDWVCSHRQPEQFVRGKSSPYQCTARVPLVVWSNKNGLIRRGAIHEMPIGTVDLLPTLLGLAGLDPEPGLPGISHAAWALHGKGPRHAEVLMGLSDWRGMFDGRHIYAARRQAGEPARPWLLFDVAADPHDMINRVALPSHRDLARELHARLRAAVAATGDAFASALE